MANITLTGTVDRVFFDGKGLAITEVTHVKGHDFKETYTCWFAEAPAVSLGDTVTVSGKLGKKIEAYTSKTGEARQSFNLIVNLSQVATPAFDALPF